MGQAGRLEAIWIKRAQRGPMDARQEAVLEKGLGLRGNADRGGRRQVTLIDGNAWQEASAELKAEVDPAGRRANLMLEAVRLAQTRGKVLRVGASRRFLGETRPCERMEEVCPGLKTALERDWRGGVFAEVLQGGTIRVGDAVEWKERHEA